MNDLQEFDKNISNITQEQWKQLFKLIPIISRTKNFGKFSPIKKTIDGNMILPYMQPSKIVQRFHHIVYDIGTIHPFDWMEWDEGKKLLDNSKTDFDKLDIKTLCMLITTIVRNDRFSDGYLVQCFNEGIILKIIKAMKINIRVK